MHNNGNTNKLLVNHVIKHFMSPTRTKLNLKYLDLTHKNTTNMIADSGTNITLVNDNIRLLNERKSMDPPPISSSKDHIHITSEGLKM